MKTLLLTLPAAALLLAITPALHAGSQIAGSLLVNINAGSYANGSPWANTGTLGGTFSPVGTTPRRESVGGLDAVVFDGQDWFSGPSAPATLTGANPTCTIECWAWNGNTSDFELMTEWGAASAPAGRELGFGFGENAAWGAFTHAGTGDGGWDPTMTSSSLDGTPPATGEWHHLVYTCDGTSARAYMDGALMKTVPVTINISASPILLGQRTASTGLPATTQGFTGALHYVRIHSDALTEEQVAANYDEDLRNRQDEARPADALKCSPIHRYSFDTPAFQDALVVPDSIGTAHGIIQGAGHVWAGGQLELPGGSSATAAYVDLPNGLISGFTDITLEVYVTLRSRQNWSRILDIGSGTAAEVHGPGGTFNAFPANGGQFVMLAACEGTTSRHVFEVSGVPHLHGGTKRTAEHNDPGITHHHVITYKATKQEWRHYMDGSLVSSIASASGPGSIPDVNVWLGRSNFSADNGFDGWIDEFRIYACALTDAEVLRNTLDGPDVLTVLRVPCSFQEWIAVNYSNDVIPGLTWQQYFQQDWDHDGISIGTEYSLLTLPGVSSASAQIIPTLEMETGGGPAMTFTYRRLITLPEVDLIPQITASLSNWTPAQNVERISAVDNEDGTLTETVRIRDLPPARAFGRLLVAPR